MNPITDDEIDHVCTLIAEGRTMEPVPRCGSILLECFRLGLLEKPRRAVPTLTEAGHVRVKRVH